MTCLMCVVPMTMLTHTPAGTTPWGAPPVRCTPRDIPLLRGTRWVAHRWLTLRSALATTLWSLELFAPCGSHQRNGLKRLYFCGDIGVVRCHNACCDGQHSERNGMEALIGSTSVQ
ncbi:hypothetical protein BJY52DRAFT_1271188 [Lactarius psammicola]|nr:hypothetical protein BJY52DRAFT_1271188 [Lactarius psammicola]